MSTTKTNILKARVGECWDKKNNVTLFNLEFKAANSRFFRGYSVDYFQTRAEADQALEDHNSGKNPYGVSAVHPGGSYFFCKKGIEHKEEFRDRAYKIGDIVPYTNSNGHIKLARIVGFKNTETKRCFFGKDTITNYKVFHSVLESKELEMLSSKKGDVKEFSCSSGFDINDICYNIKCNGIVYEKDNTLIDGFVPANFHPYFEWALSLSVYRNVSDNI
ncbi:hypothetical protein, partial [Macellibacteroides fermentans]|uniref:hypothetical protein n=1 Tax=Macellibacteroides fermentans TaxID=879969 RepID=UPI00406C51F8